MRLRFQDALADLDTTAELMFSTAKGAWPNPSSRLTIAVDYETFDARDVGLGSARCLVMH